MKSRLKFSVCIPVYNGEKTIARAIASVMNQTYDGSYEIIIVDNASTDCTEEVVKPLIGKGIQYFRNDKNIGMVRNWNRCIELASGEWIYILCDDDIVLPTALETFTKAENKYPDVKMVFGKDINIDEVSSEISFLPTIYDIDRYFPKGMLLDDLIERCFIGLSAVVVKRDIYRTLNGFIDDNMACDYYMWMLISALYPVAFVNEFMGVRYYNRNSITWDNGQKLTADTVTVFNLLISDSRVSDFSVSFKVGGAVWSFAQTKSLILKNKASEATKCFEKYSELSKGIEVPKLRHLLLLGMLLRTMKFSPRIGRWIVRKYANLRNIDLK